MSNLTKISDMIGLLGVFLILFAYFYLQIEKWTSKSIMYLSSNLLGALLVICSLIFNWNLSAFIIETVWAIISMVGIIKAISKKSQ